MRIEKITLNGNEFRLFYVEIENEEICVAEEKLENFIQDCIEKELYHFVENVDEMYSIYIPQEVADTENESEIKESIMDII